MYCWKHVIWDGALCWSVIKPIMPACWKHAQPLAVWYRPMVSAGSHSLQHMPCRKVRDKCGWLLRGCFLFDSECLRPYLHLQIIALQVCNKLKMVQQCGTGQWSAQGAAACSMCPTSKYLTNAAGGTEAASCTHVSFSWASGVFSCFQNAQCQVLTCAGYFSMKIV